MLIVLGLTEHIFSQPVLPAFLPDPRDGSIYMIGAGPNEPLKKLPFTIPELVAASPCKSSDGILYTGKKVRDRSIKCKLINCGKRTTDSINRVRKMYDVSRKQMGSSNYQNTCCISSVTLHRWTLGLRWTGSPAAVRAPSLLTAVKPLGRLGSLRTRTSNARTCSIPTSSSAGQSTT